MEVVMMAARILILMRFEERERERDEKVVLGGGYAVSVRFLGCIVHINLRGRDTCMHEWMRLSVAGRRCVARSVPLT